VKLRRRGLPLIVVIPLSLVGVVLVVAGLVADSSTLRSVGVLVTFLIAVADAVVVFRRWTNGRIRKNAERP